METRVLLSESYGFFPKMQEMSNDRINNHLISSIKLFFDQYNIYLFDILAVAFDTICKYISKNTKSLSFLLLIFQILSAVFECLRF